MKQATEERPVLVIEEFDGFVSCVDGPTAFVTLRTDDGEVLYGQYPADTLAAMGIKESRRFLCRTIEVGGTVDIELVAIPDVELTDEQVKEIDERINGLLADWEDRDETGH